MNRIDANVTELMPKSSSGFKASMSSSCWVCQTNLSARAAFCHDCGTIQPCRSLDHFTRLGFDRRYDIDRALFTDRFEAMRRVFLAERFTAKGPRQQQLATDHLSVLEEAYAVLADPVRRADYLLNLVDAPPVPVEDNPVIIDLKLELSGAADAAVIDRVAHKARHGVELAMRDLSGAFRAQNYTEAAIVLARLTQLEDIAATARVRRGDL
jgi:molecular chaperone HscB